MRPGVGTLDRKFVERVSRPVSKRKSDHGSEIANPSSLVFSTSGRQGGQVPPDLHSPGQGAWATVTDLSTTCLECSTDYEKEGRALLASPTMHAREEGNAVQGPAYISAHVYTPPGTIVQNHTSNSLSGHAATATHDQQHQHQRQQRKSRQREPCPDCADTRARERELQQEVRALRMEVDGLRLLIRRALR